jgi:hypothetical protein
MTKGYAWNDLHLKSSLLIYFGRLGKLISNQVDNQPSILQRSTEYQFTRETQHGIRLMMKKKVLGNLGNF